MADESKTQATEYVVLRQANGTEVPEDGGTVKVETGWVEVGEPVTAVNAQAAIKAATEGAGTFVAVPARSWKPMTRKVETVTKDVWS